MTRHDIDRRLDTIERQLREPANRESATLWQERLDLLRVIDRANAKGGATAPEEG